MTWHLLQAAGSLPRKTVKSEKYNPSPTAANSKTIPTMIGIFIVNDAIIITKLKNQNNRI
jgi:hypothetical protein